MITQMKPMDKERVIKVLIVDDQREMRIGLSLILNKNPSIQVIGSATHGQDLLEKLECLKTEGQELPDVIIMDVRMPIMDGIATTRHLTTDYPTIRVLVLTTYDQDDYAFGALEAGASGFLLKDSRAHELRAAVCAIANGDAVLTPRITRQLLLQSPLFKKKQPEEIQRISHLFMRLTKREKEICELVAEGYTNSEIADKIVVQTASVKRALTRILSKLEMRDRVQIAIAWHKLNYERD